MEEAGIIGKVANRLKQALDGLFEETPSATPLFPENVPQPIPEPTIAISKSRSQQPTPSKPETKEPFGKITSYNYKNEELPDTLSQSMKGAWDNTLSNQGLAVSPDIEKQFREQGIKPKDKVKIVLADGTELERIWEDRTMQDKQAIRKFGKPLRGRFDLHMPQSIGPHEKDGISVVGFQKLASAE